MKKLLFVSSILALSSVSFSASIGTADSAKMNISAHGKIVKAASQLVVTVDGDDAATNLDFDFGNLLPGATKTVTKSFHVGKVDKSSLVGDKETLSANLAKLTQEFKDGDQKVATFNYNLTFDQVTTATTDKLGTIRADITVENNILHEIENVNDINELKISIAKQA